MIVNVKQSYQWVIVYNPIDYNVNGIFGYSKESQPYK